MLLTTFVCMEMRGYKCILVCVYSNRLDCIACKSLIMVVVSVKSLGAVNGPEKQRVGLTRFSLGLLCFPVKLLLFPISFVFVKAIESIVPSLLYAYMCIWTVFSFFRGLSYVANRQKHTNQSSECPFNLFSNSMSTFLKCMEVL